MMRLTTIRSKLLSSILSIVILPVFILGIWGYHFSKQTVLQQSEAAILSQLKQVGSGIESRLDQINHYSKLVIFDANVQRLIQHTDLKGRNRQNWSATRELNRFFFERINSNYLMSTGVVRLTGGLFQYADRLGLTEDELRNSHWFDKALNGRGAAVWSMEDHYLVLARLIRDSAYQYSWNNLGVVYFYISPDVFMDPISEARQLTPWYILNSDGMPPENCTSYKVSKGMIN